MLHQVLVAGSMCSLRTGAGSQTMGQREDGCAPFNFLVAPAKMKLKSKGHNLRTSGCRGLEAVCVQMEVYETRYLHDNTLGLLRTTNKQNSES